MTKEIKFIEIPLNNIIEEFKKDTSKALKFLEQLSFKDLKKFDEAAKEARQLRQDGLNSDHITFRISTKSAKIFNFSNIKLKSLDLKGLYNKDLLTSLESNKSLENLDLSENNIGNEAVEVLKKISSLVQIDLSNNNIDLKGANNLAGYLANNDSLGALYLEGNNLTDEGIIFIAKSLKTNTGLFALSLRDCGIDIKGADALIDLLVINHNITSIFLSKKDVKEIKQERVEEINALLNKNRSLKEVDKRPAIFTDNISKESLEKKSKVFSFLSLFNDTKTKLANQDVELQTFSKLPYAKLSEEVEGHANDTDSKVPSTSVTSAKAGEIRISHGKL
jgi:hypothetical protein